LTANTSAPRGVLETLSLSTCWASSWSILSYLVINLLFCNELSFSL